MMPIELKHICKSYGEKSVLKDVTLTLIEGVTCLMAPSGAGKTTLLRLMLGLEKPDSGSVRGMPERAAVLFQEDRLVESLTVRKNLRLALGEGCPAERMEKMLSSLGLEAALEQPVATLSGGMKRRAALARALLYDAPVLLLDEPFKGLDAENRRLAQAAVRGAAGGRIVLVITHDGKDCEALQGRVVKLGEISKA